MLGPTVIAAVGLGFAFVPVTIAAMTGVAERRVGAGARADQHLPAGRRGVGLAVLGSIASSKTDDLLGAVQGAPSPAVAANALTEGFQVAFMVGAVFAVIAIITTLVFIRSEDSKAVVGASPNELPMACRLAALSA